MNPAESLEVLLDKPEGNLLDCPHPSVRHCQVVRAVQIPVDWVWESSLLIYLYTWADALSRSV